MALKKSTKDLLMDALVQILQQREFSKVRVREILEVSGVSRQSFYTHFRDKYHVLSSVLQRDLFQGYEQVGRGISWRDWLIAKYESTRENLNYYRKIYRQPEIKSALEEMFLEQAVKVVQTRYPIEDKALFTLRLFAESCYKLSNEWLFYHSDQSPTKWVVFALNHILPEWQALLTSPNFLL